MPSSEPLQVRLGRRSYPIHIGRGLLSRRDLLAPWVEDRQVVVITSETIAPLYLDTLIDNIASRETERVVLGDGEQQKTLETFGRIMDRLLGAGFSRDCVVVALGGGVVGDIAGFVAGCYQRGVSFVQVPTTLLAQVDSSVGGKTGVNHPLGKNMIGVFHQPVCVLADMATLETLPDGELRAGLAEVVKYALIVDPLFFAWLEEHAEALLAKDGEALAHAVRRCCEIKADIVAQDEREGGARALLNLGHTFGHAIEAGLGYGRWRHGEAVAAGICAAAHLSRRMDWVSSAEHERIQALFALLALPTRIPHELSPARMLELMARDKKVEQGRLRLILLRSLGDAQISRDFEPQALQDTLAECRG